MLWAMIGLSFGNGQSSHLWISKQAIELLPQGELYDLLSNPDYEKQWRNGTMFPDGGYAIGDNYGEIAHWEPFQRAYLEWIQSTHSYPWSVEAKEHIAFLMGLASHGLADQSYDAMYFRRAYVYDADGMWSESFDTATDVAFVAQTEVQPTSDVWVPYTDLLPIFEAQGHIVSQDTISQGQSRLNVAVYWVGSTASQPDLVDEYTAQFPWGTTNQLNLDVPGNPTMESQIVAAYWQTVWDQLMERSANVGLLFTHPPSNGYEHPKGRENIESGLAFGLSVGIDERGVLPEHIQVLNPQGDAHPIVVEIFYGQDSHIVNIDPLEDWSDGEHRVIISPELPLNNGAVVGHLNQGKSLEWFFSTAQRQHSTEVDDPVQNKRGCQQMGAAVWSLEWWWLLVYGWLWRRK